MGGKGGPGKSEESIYMISKYGIPKELINYFKILICQTAIKNIDAQI